VRRRLRGHALPCGHRFHAACVIDWLRSLGANHDQWRKRSKQMLAMRVLINSFQIDRFVVREVRHPLPAPA
jgi:hypothetical protein